MVLNCLLSRGRWWFLITLTDLSLENSPAFPITKQGCGLLSRPVQKGQNCIVRCMSESYPLLLAQEELDLKQMMEDTSETFEMNGMHFQAILWLGLGGRRVRATIMEKNKTLAYDYDSRKNVIRALSSYQRKTLVIVRGCCSHWKGRLVEDPEFKAIPGLHSKLSEPAQTRVPSFSRHWLSYATCKTLPGTGGSEI